MKLALNRFAVLGIAISLVGCGAGVPEQTESAPAETVDNTATSEVGEVEQAVEYQKIGPGQLKSFSAWLTGSTPWKIYNLSTSNSVPYTVYCGEAYFHEDTVAVGPTPAEGKATCAYWGARVYVKNRGTTSDQVLDVYTY